MLTRLHSQARAWAHVLRSGRIVRLVLLLVLFGSGFTLSRHYDVVLAVSRNAVPDPESEYVPRFARERGPQLELVYVGSSSCAWSNQAPLPDAVEKIKLRLAAAAAEHGWSFKTVGVALDWSPEPGLAHLAKFGRFDEVAAGYNWGNTLALRYLWAEEATEAATPQVLVYRRFAIAPRDTGDILYYGERDRVLLAGRVGADGIAQWADSGAVLPQGIWEDTPVTVEPDYPEGAEGR